jgi:hypothetical protein
VLIEARLLSGFFSGRGDRQPNAEDVAERDQAAQHMATGAVSGQ